MIRFIEGDLLDLNNPHGLEAYAHGCNCRGVMGAGVAAKLRALYPGMYEGYRALCLAKPRAFNPGDSWYWGNPGGPGVYCLATQDGYGRAGPHARPEHVRAAFSSMLRDAEARGVVVIGCPAVGSGLGGLPWPAVKEVIQDVCQGSGVDVVCFERYASA